MFSAYANCKASFERRLTSSHKAGSLFKLLPHDGISSRSFLRYSSDFALSGKQRFSRLIIIGTDVDAPGDAPNKAAIEPSALDTTSVPNSKIPPCFGSFLITCTRCPATSTFQSSNFAVGINCFKESNLSDGLFMTSVIRYFVKSRLCKTAEIIGLIFDNLIEAGRSKYEPFFKNFVEKPAYGPNNKACSPSI